MAQKDLGKLKIRVVYALEGAVQGKEQENT